MKPLFFIGNKRSGTSRLCVYLNQHPKVFVTNESDVAWLLYQVYEKGIYADDLPYLEEKDWGTRQSIAPFLPHRLDIGSAGTVHTMRALGDVEGPNLLGRADMTPFERFVAIQKRYHDHIVSSRSLSPYSGYIKQYLPKDWNSLKVLGDKMPTQVADPDVFKWITDVFPDAVFVHIVRHPGAVVASMQHLRYNTWWRGTVEEVLDQWAKIEQWALDVEKQAPTIRVRQEDMAREPDVVVNGIFEWLGLDPIELPRNVWTRGSHPVKLPQNSLVDELLAEYGY